MGLGVTTTLPLTALGLWLVVMAAIVTTLITLRLRDERRRENLEDDLLAVALAVGVVRPDSVGWRR